LRGDERHEIENARRGNDPHREAAALPPLFEARGEQADDAGDEQGGEEKVGRGREEQVCRVAVAGRDERYRGQSREPHGPPGDRARCDEQGEQHHRQADVPRYGAQHRERHRPQTLPLQLPRGADLVGWHLDDRKRFTRWTVDDDAARRARGFEAKAQRHGDDRGRDLKAVGRVRRTRRPRQRRLDDQRRDPSGRVLEVQHRRHARQPKAERALGEEQRVGTGDATDGQRGRPADPPERPRLQSVHGDRNLGNLQRLFDRRQSLEDLARAPLISCLADHRDRAVAAQLLDRDF
jgi:hypothetical protein